MSGMDLPDMFGCDARSFGLPSAHPKSWLGLLGLPVNLRIVLFQPGLSKDDILSAQVSDGEHSMFHVPIYLENNIHNFLNRASLISASIHVVDQDGSLELLGSEVVTFYIVPVHELSGGPTIY